MKVTAVKKFCQHKTEFTDMRDLEKHIRPLQACAGLELSRKHKLQWVLRPLLALARSVRPRQHRPDSIGPNLAGVES